MTKYIDADALMKDFDGIDLTKCVKYGNEDAEQQRISYSTMMMYEIADALEDAPAADVVEVVRCEDCIYYHKEHVECPDGSEKDFSEFPKEAFGTLGIGVTAEYGINVGGQCELEEEPVFREPNDFCSRGKKVDKKEE